MKRVTPCKASGVTRYTGMRLLAGVKVLGSYWQSIGRRYGHRRRNWAVVVLMALMFALAAPLALASSGTAPKLAVIEWLGRPDSEALIRDGFRRVDQAADTTATANTASDWDRAMVDWMGAIATLQAVPGDAPQRAFLQRQQRQYLQQLVAAQRQAELTSLPSVFPNLGSPVLNEQLVLYLSYVATFGPPDVLIVGSSRALYGIDPSVLEQALAARPELAPVSAYNLSVNGATAQVLNFMLQRLLPDQLPRVVVWGTGSRGFNSARFDTTFANVLDSPGYQTALTGNRPGFGPVQSAPIVQPSSLTSQGFLPVATVFDPAVYYQSFPRVEGRFDGFYNPFNLDGVQTVSFRSLVGFLRSRQIPLVMVNLPLSGDFLDPFRTSLEQRFQQFLQTEGERLNFQVVDLLTQWQNRNDVFADPSHLNQMGADAISRQLANTPAILSTLNQTEPERDGGLRDRGLRDRTPESSAS